MKVPAAHFGRVAIVTSQHAHTFQELDQAADRVARALLAGRADLEEARVAFLVQPGFDYAAILLGVWRAGGVAVPLAVSHPATELDYVIRDAAADVVVADASFVDTLQPLAFAAGAHFATSTDFVKTAADDAPALLPDVASTRRALMVYTSGTTGRPKGVVTTHGNIDAQVSSLVSAWEWTDADRALLVLPLHHVHGIINVLCSALRAGAACEILPRFDADQIWDRLASGELTVFTAVPTMYHRLIASWDAAAPAVRQARAEGARALRLMMSGSAALPVHQLERWRDITGHTLLERYGMTEIGMALSNPLHGERRPGTVGQPLPGVAIRVVDEEDAEVLPGTPGEIQVKGPGVFLEYWNRPDETREAFRDGWFRTGDVAILDGGAYRLLGRMSVDIIKTGGYKVSALDIEEVLRAHPAIVDCAVVGVPDEAWGERVCVAIEARPNVALDVETLQEWARSRLAPYKVPRALRAVAALPRNAMGKVVKPDVVRLFTV